ncbi:MAG: 4-alpha-glucanotransferase [Bacteroidia bacterium]
MTKIRFKIHYHTEWGQSLYVSGSFDELGNWDANLAKPMHYLADGFWELQIESSKIPKDFSYKYLLRSESGGDPIWEWGENRFYLSHNLSFEELEFKDYWQASGDPENAWLSSAFTKVLMRRKNRKSSLKVLDSSEPKHRFQLIAPRVGRDYHICLIGEGKALGNWNEKKAIVLDDSQFPIWQTQLELGDFNEPLAYKYGIYDKKQKKILTWEGGNNRKIYPTDRPKRKRISVITDTHFRYPDGNWKGAGVAIPVFSLRSKNGLGIGEFQDLRPMIDWSLSVGMKLVQILPINDTSATHTWVDSYPYSAISVFALHPMYANLEAMGVLKTPGQRAEFMRIGETLNKLPEIDYEAVMEAKNRYFKLIYAQDKAKTFRLKAYKEFFKEHSGWLKPYAVFCMLRDRFGTVDFNQWPEYGSINQATIDELADPKSERYDEIGLHYFIQYHLHQQLKSVSDYANEKGVVFKGDLPIGVYRHSVDAWLHPELFFMNAQAGAPPDAFAVKGQNWRFPTYNWRAMAQDGYAWWRARLTHMAQYFDAYRIDHILGFFRIWQIPGHAVEGLLGQFNPSLPFSIEEIERWGIWWDEDRYTKPYIRTHMLEQHFGLSADGVKQEFLEDLGYDIWQFKEHLNTQRKIEAYINEQIKKDPSRDEWLANLKAGLYSLCSEVLFIPAINGKGFDPRIAMHQTFSYQELDDHHKSCLNELYNHYFYHRHESFWRDQALVKLPAIQSATDMLVCGEDLGMVPDSVPGVMQDRGILSLEIQRMPKDPKKEFAHPADAPYMSVVSPSTHDMATIRSWWEEDRALSERFFSEVMGREDEAPWFCEPWVAREIIAQHMYSPSMWAIFPLQDLLAINADIRRENPDDERINIPANPEHYWRYRMHLSLDELASRDSFNHSLHHLIKDAGRDEAY